MKPTNGWSAALAACLFLLLPVAQAADDGSDTPIWGKVRTLLVGDRPVIEDTTGSVLEIDAPVRAEDAAVVPVAGFGIALCSSRKAVSKACARFTTICPTQAWAS